MLGSQIDQKNEVIQNLHTSVVSSGLKVKNLLQFIMNEEYREKKMLKEKEKKMEEKWKELEEELDRKEKEIQELEEKEEEKRMKRKESRRRKAEAKELREKIERINVRSDNLSEVGEGSRDVSTSQVGCSPLSDLSSELSVHFTPYSFSSPSSQIKSPMRPSSLTPLLHLYSAPYYPSSPGLLSFVEGWISMPSSLSKLYSEKFADSKSLMKGNENDISDNKNNAPIIYPSNKRVSLQKYSIQHPSHLLISACTSVVEKTSVIPKIVCGPYAYYSSYYAYCSNYCDCGCCRAGMPPSNHDHVGRLFICSLVLFICFVYLVMLFKNYPTISS
jgi:hypothetical protein